MLKIFLGVTNSNKVSLKSGAALILLSFLPFNVGDEKFGEILNVRKESEKMHSYTSCAKDLIYFCTCVGECLLKMKSKTFRRKL